MCRKVLVVSLLAVAALWEAPLCYAETLSTDTLRAQVISILQSAKTVRAQFAQQKFIAALTKPLKSSGTFIFVSSRGVVWQQHAPFQSTFVLTPHGAYYRADNAIGERTQESTTLKRMADLFLSLFGGDQQVLNSQFEAAVSGTAEEWSLALTPRNSRLKEFIEKIVLSGARTLDRVEIFEPPANRTQIDFSRTERNVSLSESELRLLSRDTTTGSNMITPVQASGAK